MRIRQRDLDLHYCDISDPIIINERVVRIQYSATNISLIRICGLAASLRQKNTLIFQLPADLNEITVQFIGARKTIEHHQRFVFLKANVDEGVFEREVKTTKFVRCKRTSHPRTCSIPVLKRIWLALDRNDVSALNIKRNREILLDEFKSEIHYP